MTTQPAAWFCSGCGQHNTAERFVCFWCSKDRREPTAKDTTTLAVDHPAHYGGDTTYETIKVLEARFTPEQMAGFNLGNAVKYISRAGKKGAALEDLQKARWYLDREISRREAK